MVRKTMQWVPITALLLAVAWRPSANYQILLHFLICTGAVMVVLALFFIKHAIDPTPRGESLQSRERGAP